MRDYRDAKAMAHTLRDALAAKQYKITVGESLELIARLFGVADWNTLSAIIKNSDRASGAAARREANSVQFAQATEETLRRTFAAAQSRNQEATIENLLLALTDDPDAAAVMEACNAAPATIKQRLHGSGKIARIHNDYPGQHQDPIPTPAFQRVVQRAILNLEASGGGDLTGAHLLAAIFLGEDAGVFAGEEMAAVRILVEQGVNQKAVLRIVTGRGD